MVNCTVYEFYLNKEDTYTQKQDFYSSKSKKPKQLLPPTPKSVLNYTEGMLLLSSMEQNQEGRKR